MDIKSTAAGVLGLAMAATGVGCKTNGALDYSRPGAVPASHSPAYVEGTNGAGVLGWHKSENGYTASLFPYKHNQVLDLHRK